MSSVILRTEKLCKSFSVGGNQQHVLKNMDIEIIQGDFTIIMGSSGSGKSTLLYALSGMDKPTMGKVRFMDREISSYSNDQLAVFRRKNCGFVFQNIYLLDNMSVLDNLLTSGLLIEKNTKKLVKEAKQLLTLVGLDEKLWSKFPAQLSGGETQRVGIARALMNQPTIVFGDEPTGSLNSMAGKVVLDVLCKIHENGQTVVLVTHDIKTALRGNRVLYVKDGTIFGTLQLGEYVESESESRRKKLQQFLDEMGW